MKSGIEYFPLDVSLDSKFELVEAEFGLTGFAVVVKLFQRIFGGEGYYCEWTEEVALLFTKNVGLGGNAVSEIVSAAIKRGIFDKVLFDRYRVLTSRGIQKRYFEAVSRRKEIIIKKQYLLIDVAHICKNVSIIEENVYINGINADISKQSRVEESIVKNSNDEDEEGRPPSCGNDNIDELPDSEYAKALHAWQNKMGTINIPRLALNGLCDYTKTMPAEVISYALDLAEAAQSRNWSYIETILRGWQDKGVRTLADAKRERETFKNRQKGGSKDASNSGGSDKPRISDRFKR